jgi:glycosyltransferase involved in cell wall biosynthesis
MRVAVNCLNLDASFVGGLNTFTQGMLQGFSAAANGHQFRLYATSENLPLFEAVMSAKCFEVIVMDARTHSLRRDVCRASLLSLSERVYENTSNFVFRGLRESMDDHADIIYTPSVVLQYFDSRKPSVLSMHDIQHVHHPEFFSWPRRLSRHVTYGLSARHAGFLQASSEFIKQDFLRHFDCISAERIVVIPEGVDVEAFAAAKDTSALRTRYDIPERYLFFPAQFWPHKNHLILLRALERIKAVRGTPIPLVLTGGKYGAASDVFRFLAEHSMDYVHYLGKVPFSDLVGLYQGAAFLVMPSLHESSSLPILEAAAAGTPVIASRIPPNEELGKVLQLNLFDPRDPGDLAAVLMRLWEDESTATEQAAQNRLKITCYSWESAATQYLRLFEGIVNS